jgi:hypothetical protein|tara:strand:- start:169 stop:273 length:105 start_codon:yes stop_codon:yes gene_type:complete
MRPKKAKGYSSKSKGKKIPGNKIEIKNDKKSKKS